MQQSFRQKFIIDFFQFLKTKEYVVLKFTESSIFNIGNYSDIDLAVKVSLNANIISYIHKYENILGYKVYSYSFMKMIYVFFKDNTFIELDLINNFVRKYFSYLNVKEVLDNSYENPEGVKVSRTEYNFLNIFLFYFLNKTDIDTKYQNHFLSLSILEQQKIVEFINLRFGLSTNELEALLAFNKDVYSKVFYHIKKANGFLERLKYSLLYLKNLYVNALKSKVFYIYRNETNSEFVINEFKNILFQKYRRNVVIKHNEYKNYYISYGFRSIIQRFYLIKNRIRGDVVINYYFHLNTNKSTVKINSTKYSENKKAIETLVTLYIKKTLLKTHF